MGMVEVDRDDPKAWQALVDGYLETITMPECVMVVNEEGKLRNLPLNIRATDLALDRLRLPGGGVDEIRGTAIVTGPDDGEGNFTSHPHSDCPDCWP